MSKLFENYPTITFQYKKDGNGNTPRNVVLRDICVKYSLSDKTRNNATLFYKFAMQDYLRADSLAEIYYKDSYDYWLIMLANGFFDVYSDFHVPAPIFDEVLYRKYKDDAVAAGYTDSKEDVNSYLNQTIYQYIDGDGYVVDLDTWQNDVTEGKTSITLYDYETQENDRKRNILMIDRKYKQELYNDLERKLDVFK